MIDRENAITHLQIISTWASFARERDLQFFTVKHLEDMAQWADDAITLLKEQGKKEIKLHKKYVITWRRDDEFSMRKLYEAVCETLMDEGELVIVRIDDHEKVDFTFYVTHEDTQMEL